MRTLLAVAAGFLLDLCCGDPEWLPHPVRLIGWMIERLEPLLRRLFPKDAHGLRRAGVALGLLVAAGAGLGAWGLLWLAGRVHPLAGFLLETLLCYQLLAAKSLCTESEKVRAALEREELPAARQAVSRIVGRDTDALTAAQVTRATVETVAENTSDGEIAPLFYLLLGGAPLGICYKAINTLDSMVGYKNERYLDFGRFSARLDDFAGYLPARAAALLMVTAAYLTGLDGRGAWKIWRRDRRCHPSPNSAQTEAACAGALGVQLAGPACYGGVLHKKPTIGDGRRPVEPQDIGRANKLMLVSSLLALVLFSAVKGLYLAIR